MSASSLLQNLVRGSNGFFRASRSCQRLFAPLKVDHGVKPVESEVWPSFVVKKKQLSVKVFDAQSWSGRNYPGLDVGLFETGGAMALPMIFWWGRCLNSTARDECARKVIWPLRRCLMARNGQAGIADTHGILNPALVGFVCRGVIWGCCMAFLQGLCAIGRISARNTDSTHSLLGHSSVGRVLNVIFCWQACIGVGAISGIRFLPFARSRL